MKKYSLVVSAFALLAVALASANSRTTKIGMSFAGGGQPRSVPGSINRGNGALVKAGYIFVRRGNEVDVVRVDGRFKTGTYVCSCRSGNVSQQCELQFSPKQIFCRQGSCSGTACRLVPVEPASIQ